MTEKIVLEEKNLTLTPAEMDTTPVKPLKVAATVEKVQIKLLLKRPVEGAFVAFKVGNLDDVRFIPHEKKYYTFANIEYDKNAWEAAAKVEGNAQVNEAIRLLKGK